jgi:hypothetical protein
MRAREFLSVRVQHVPSTEDRASTAQLYLLSSTFISFDESATYISLLLAPTSSTHRNRSFSFLKKRHEMVAKDEVVLSILVFEE